MFFSWPLYSFNSAGVTGLWHYAQLYADQMGLNALSLLSFPRQPWQFFNAFLSSFHMPQLHSSCWRLQPVLVQWLWAWEEKHAFCMCSWGRVSLMISRAGSQWRGRCDPSQHRLAPPTFFRISTSNSLRFKFSRISDYAHLPAVLTSYIFLISYWKCIRLVL